MNKKDLEEIEAIVVNNLIWLSSLLMAIICGVGALILYDRKITLIILTIVFFIITFILNWIIKKNKK